MSNCNLVNSLSYVGLKLTKDLGGKRINDTFFKQIVGSLMYSTATRSDIRHSASLISRFMENLKELNLFSTKRILRYLRGTVNFGLLYKKYKDTELIVFSDSDYAGDFDYK